jgi:hypothetical protein
MNLGTAKKRLIFAGESFWVQRRQLPDLDSTVYLKAIYIRYLSKIEAIPYTTCS